MGPILTHGASRGELALGRHRRVTGASPVRHAAPTLPADTLPHVTSDAKDGRERVDIVVLVSGSGTLLQALIDACAEPSYGVRIACVGADRTCVGIERAERAGIPTFVCRLGDYVTRDEWDAALASHLEAASPHLVVTAGFMKLLGPRSLGERPVVNTHPALLPSFPGAHGVRDALAYGVTVTGSTCHLVDGGVDTGPIIEQRTVAVADDDTEQTLHERIKVHERQMLVDNVGRLAREGFTVEGRRVRLGHP